MTRVMNRLVNITLATVVGSGCLLVSENFSLRNPGLLTTEAYARIGRPLTPMSYAGVARRTTRRAYAGAAVAGGAYAAGAGAARCVQVVDAYGQIVTQCY